MFKLFKSHIDDNNKEVLNKPVDNMKTSNQNTFSIFELAEQIGKNTQMLLDEETNALLEEVFKSLDTSSKKVDRAKIENSIVVKQMDDVSEMFK